MDITAKSSVWRSATRRVLNVVADHLCRLRFESSVDCHINDSFLNDHLFAVSTQSPWFTDITNYCVGDSYPSDMTYQQRKKFYYDAKHYLWEDLVLYKKCLYGFFFIMMCC